MEKGMDTTPMEPLNVLVVDDEPGARELMCTLLREDPHVRQVVAAASLQDALQHLAEQRIDLLLLDIELAGADGFQVLEGVPAERTPAVIFATAHAHYALRAIPKRPFAYLLKPIDPEELAAAVKQVAAHALDREAVGEQAILELHTLTERHFIPMENVVQLESDGSYTKVHVRNGAALMVSRHLGYWEARLPGKLFFRCHRSHIIALAHVRSYSTDDGGTVLLSNGDKVPLATRKHTVFQQRMKKMQGA